MTRLIFISLSVLMAAATSCNALAGAAQAETALHEPTSTEVTPPATGVIMHPGYAKTIGRMAYVWGWPMVNMLNRSASVTRRRNPGA